MRKTVVLLCCALAAACWAGISILEKDGRAFTGPTPPPPYAKLLADNGFSLGFPGDEMRTTAPLTPEKLRQFNVIVVPSLIGWTTDMKAKELTAMLDAHLKAGGGVLLYQNCYLEGQPLFVAMNDWLKSYGASLRWEELVDPAHAYQNPPAVPWQAPVFYWTDAITPSPITKDVKALFYVPGKFRAPYMMGMDVDTNWQVLARTMPTTQRHKVIYDKSNDYPGRTTDAPTEGAVTLLAVRKVGKGRLAVFGGSPAAYWFDLKKPVYAGVPQERGDGQRKSDWIPLLVNLLHWLGEPSAKAGKPGGYTGQVQHQVQPDWGNRTAIDWDVVEKDGVSPALVQQTLTWHSGVSPQDWADWDAGKYRPYKVLVGARTRLSGGKGTVADWKAAALAVGYSVVVFREDILKLSKEQWDGFVKECAAASDAQFRAVPGQEFEDWIGNRFMRFTGDLMYPPHKERLTDGKVRDQLSWFFDVGWPVNFPISPKTNTTEYWNYRVYDAWPIYVYQDGKLTEDNRRPWEELVDSYEYPSPLALHLLDDPAQVATAAKGAVSYILSNGLPNLDGRWAGGYFGTHNNPRVVTTTGPVIDRFHALNMYRTTLGSREVPGSYRYKVFIKAHSEKPIARVELWGGDEALRVYRPNAKAFSVVVDEMHDRQRGLWLKVVDADGGEARSTGIMVHDKMHWFIWCGDHCNALPAGLAMTDDGSVMYYGVGTRVKSSFQGIDGPAASGYDMWRYVPWGTDTSAPAVGTQGQVRLVTADGKTLPDWGTWYTSRVQMPYGTRDFMVERLVATRGVIYKDYVPKFQPTTNGWYPYTKNADLPAISIAHEDVDIHRDAGEPALQWNYGTITFNQDVTLSTTAPLNVILTNFNTNTQTTVAYTNAGELPKGTSIITLGKGGYLTWGALMGNVTIYGLDDAFTVQVNYDGKKVVPSFGLKLKDGTFNAGATLDYRMLIMRWPTGMPLSDRLDVKAAAALNLAGHQPSFTVTPRAGKVAGTQFLLDLQAENGAFAGTISRAFLGMRIPGRVSGINPRSTAAVWRKGVANQVLAPLAARQGESAAYFTLDIDREAGELFIGNLVTCDKPDLWIRVLQRTDGGCDVVAHNPGETAIATTLKGGAGSPLEGWTQAVTLQPGEEKRVKGK
jgi:hypothetical protein